MICRALHFIGEMVSYVVIGQCGVVATGIDNVPRGLSDLALEFRRADRIHLTGEALHW